MPELLRILCPLDGLQISTRQIAGQAKNRFEDNTVREHVEFSVNQAFTCANGHTWNVSGDLNIRINPTTGL